MARCDKYKFVNNNNDYYAIHSLKELDASNY